LDQLDHLPFFGVRKHKNLIQLLKTKLDHLTSAVGPHGVVILKEVALRKKLKLDHYERLFFCNDPTDPTLIQLLFEKLDHLPALW
jgi:hypothetical protein